MPQAAWEALLHDAVQGLRPPYTPQALRQWLQATHPQAWAVDAPSPPRPSRHHHTRKGEDKGKGRARDTKGHSGKRARGGGQVRAGTHRDRTPEEAPHGGRKPPKNQEGAGAGTKARRKRAPRQTPRPTPRKGIPRRGDQRRSNPIERPTNPGGAPPNTHPRSKHRTPYGSRQRTPTSHRKPHGEWEGHQHGENGPHPQRKPQGTPPQGAPPRPHCQATTPAATRATSQAPEEDKGTATATRTRDRNPPRTRDQGAGPQGGQPHGPSRDQPTRPTSPSGTPKPPQHGPSETPTPNRTSHPPASHTPARTHRPG